MGNLLIVFFAANRVQIHWDNILNYLNVHFIVLFLVIYGIYFIVRRALATGARGRSNVREKWISSNKLNNLNNWMTSPAYNQPYTSEPRLQKSGQNMKKDLSCPKVVLSGSTSVSMKHCWDWHGQRSCCGWRITFRIWLLWLRHSWIKWMALQMIWTNSDSAICCKLHS